MRLPPQEDGDEEPWATPASGYRKEPPIVGELPERMELILGNQIYIAKEGLPPALRNRLLRVAAFQNPEFYKAQSMRLSAYGKPRVIARAEDHPYHIGLPRGCLDDARGVLADLQRQAADLRRIGFPEVERERSAPFCRWRQLRIPLLPFFVIASARAMLK